MKEGLDRGSPPALARPGRPWKARAAWALAALMLGGLAFVAWPSPPPEALWARAKAEVDERRFDRALATLDRLRRLREPTAEDRLLRSQAEVGLGRVDAALDDLARVPDDHPQAAAARLLAGQLELRRQRLVPAEAGLLRAVALDPKRVQALRELVYIYGMQLRRPELNRTFRALAALVPLPFSEVYLWTLTRGVSWEPEEISNYLARCIEADPSDRHSRLGLAESLRQQNRLAEAEAALSPLPASDPDALTIRVRLAIDRGDDARIDALLAQGPEDHLGLALLRGRLALARGDGPAAVRHYRTAYALDPFLRDANFGLGQALMMVGDAEAAAPYLAEPPKYDRLEALMQRGAVEKNRGDAALIRDLGAACAAIGRIPEARAWYALAVRNDPLDVEAQRGLASLRDAPDAPPGR